MKRTLLYLCIITTAIAFSGCKKGGSTPTPTGSVSIVAKWNYQNELINIYSAGSKTQAGPYPYTAGEYLQFNSNNTGRDENTTFTYTYTGDVLNISYAAYTAAGVNYPAHTAVGKVTVINTSTLTILYDTTTKDSFGQLNGNITYEYLTK